MQEAFNGMKEAAAQNLRERDAALARAKAAEAEVVRLKEEVEWARAHPGGDNHHNAALCPYCSPTLEQDRTRAEAAEAEVERLRGEIRDSLSKIAIMYEQWERENQSLVQRVAELSTEAGA